MALHDHVARYGQSLTGAAAHFLGGEERIEDPRANAFGNAAAAVFDRNHHVAGFNAGFDPEFAAATVLAHQVGNGVRRIDHQIEHHLVDLAAVADDWRDVSVDGFEVGDILVLAACDHQRAGDGRVYVNLTH